MQTSNCQTIPADSNLQGWILTFASGLACCLGASVVFSDLFLQKFLCTRYFQIINSPKFLVASLSLGAGVMLYSSLYTLLHEAKESFSRTPKSKEYAGIYLIAFYFLGVIGSAVINRLIHHLLVKESSIHHHHHHHNHHNRHNYIHNIDHNHDVSHDEGSPLLKNNTNKILYCNDDACSDRLSVYIVEEQPSLESLYHRDFSRIDHHHHHHHPHSHPHHHPHHHIKSDQDQQLMRVGIQTALAISIHKFPGINLTIVTQALPCIKSNEIFLIYIEGLITFVTSQVSPTIGLALFVAIALHNISEGFTIALPLYLATHSRTKSFLYACLLGGLSQPLGALIGYLFLKESELACWDHDFIYGVLFAAVGGLMGVICIQGMLPQAIKNDKSDGNVVSIFFFIGILIMGVSSALFERAGAEP
ncbi:ZIP zinc transporter-domain-containing protein [Glomus cerebriforme]|uniref:ZIP zinc transporter-domain-containing protein n=1 Tax=Glomus cerebriforme TaxID=658196 RepID=A0A397TUB6_9GLOM|nr:ZIP zinc transporter-domain-containing protein [Glomus cerebriforme]